jgi:peptidoglycan/LPS O-acetylase OafA/YrhL
LSAPHERRHIAALDGLRGVAILLVLWFHYYGAVQSHAILPFDKLVIRLINVGWIGVDLFFVLSGFLITGILLDAKGGKGYFRNFYARRALRIFPLYYGFLFLMLVLIPRVHPYRHDTSETMRDQAWLWLYGTNIAQTFFHRPLTGFTPMWSLAVEEHFYLVWPAVVFLVPRRRLMAVCLSVFLFALALRAIFLWNGIWPASFTLCRADSLALGAFVAAVVRGEGPKHIKSVRYIMICCLIPLVWLFATAKDLSSVDQRMAVIGYSLLGIVMACVVFLVAIPDAMPWLARLLRTTWLRSIGKYSYAMYIFHWTLIPLVAKFFVQFGLEPRIGSRFIAQLPFAIFSTILCYLLAFASWHLYEKHFLKLKRFFEYGTESSSKFQELATFNCVPRPQ